MMNKEYVCAYNSAHSGNALCNVSCQVLSAWGMRNCCGGIYVEWRMLLEPHVCTCNWSSKTMTDRTAVSNNCDGTPPVVSLSSCRGLYSLCGHCSWEVVNLLTKVIHTIQAKSRSSASYQYLNFFIDDRQNWLHYVNRIDCSRIPERTWRVVHLLI